MSAQRPRSVRSVTSNSSLASTVSLARRPRTTRARSRTVTGTSESPTSAVSTDDPPPAMPFFTGPLVQEPLEDGPSPPRPPRSPHRLAVETLCGSDTTSSRGVEGSTFVVEHTQNSAVSQSNASKQASGLPHRMGPPVETLGGSDTASSHGVEGSTFVVEPTQPTPVSQASKQASSLPHRLGLPMETLRGSDTSSSRGVEGSTFVVEPTQSSAITASAPQSKASKQASSLPHLDTTPRYKPPPSAFSRDPGLTPGKNVRDSLSTEQSGMSSSLYPPSTSTASGPASPLSPSNQMDAPSIVLDTQEYDGHSDDVAYRLRLLVQNSYFLPPAHSKPSPADFAPSPQQKKASAPTFLDIFRMGKSRSKPTTPTGTGPVLPPMLRTTGDSITPAFVDQPHTAPRIPTPTARGRVVVVREKMLDIATAAKQAEQEVKARGARTESQHDAPSIDDDDIDPTDAVDLPLPPPSYPFAVQASALHGLGVAESVGAAILADLLPPSQNPTLAREYDAAEDSWRKLLLREAVGHSLDNTPDASMSIFSQPLSPEPNKSMSLEKERKMSLQSQAQTQTPQTRQTPAQAHAQLLGRKITDALPLPETPSPAATLPARPVPPGSHNNPNTVIVNFIPNTTTNSNTTYPPSLRKSSEIPRNSITITTTRPTTNSNRISTKRSLGLSPTVVAEIEMLEGLSLSMPRPGSTLPPRADTPVEPQTPLGPPPRPPRVTQAMSAEGGSSGSPGGGSNSAGGQRENEQTVADDAEWGRNNDEPDHSALRRTVSSPSLAEEYESAVSRRAGTQPPLPLHSIATGSGTKAATAGYRLSQVTVTSFNTLNDDDDYERDHDGSRSQFESRSGTHVSGRSRRSLSDPRESDYEQTPGRVSLALSAFPAPSTRTRSPTRSRSRSQSQSRPSLSEYSQASLSPTTSAFQEMLNHDQSHDYDQEHTLTHRTRGSLSAPPSTAPTPEPGVSSMGLAAVSDEQEQRYATYIDAARLEAMSPPPRNSSSLAFEALPAPPRGASLAYSHSTGTSNGASTRNSNFNAKPHAHSSYMPPPRPLPGPAPAPGQFHVGRSYSQPPVRRYPASPSTFGSSPTIATTTATTSTTASGQPVLGPAPLAFTLEILAPEPTTPPLPPDTSFGDDATIPALSASAAGTRSGTGVASFFDSIQSHMDGLESSEDEDDDDEEEVDDDDDYRYALPPPAPPPTASSLSFNTNTGSGAFGATASSPGRPRTASVAADTSPRRPIMMMKHANFSAPYIRSTGEGHNHGSASPSASGQAHAQISSKHAVSNVAVKPKALWQPASTDFFKYAQEHPAAVGSAAASGGGSSSTAAVAAGAAQGRGSTQQNGNAKAQESLRRFDGMLQQHIEAEKDTLKRIATTLKQQQRQRQQTAQDLNLPGRR